MLVINQGRISYTYKKSEGSPQIHETICTNQVVTCIIDDVLQVEKCVDKKEICLYDIAKYTIKIKNISDSCVSNIWIYDVIPENTGFIEDSLRVNGCDDWGICPRYLYIGCMERNEVVIVSYSVVVEPWCHKKVSYILSSGSAGFDFFCNADGEMGHLRIPMNDVVTKVVVIPFLPVVNKSCFKITDIHNIVCIEPRVKIIRCKIINTEQGYQVQVLWKQFYKITYWKDRKQLNLVVQDYYSGRVSVPPGVKYAASVCVNVKEEDVRYLFCESDSRLFVRNKSVIVIA